MHAFLQFRPDPVPLGNEHAVSNRGWQGGGTVFLQLRFTLEFAVEDVGVGACRPSASFS